MFTALQAFEPFKSTPSVSLLFLIVPNGAFVLPKVDVFVAQINNQGGDFFVFNLLQESITYLTYEVCYYFL